VVIFLSPTNSSRGRYPVKVDVWLAAGAETFLPERELLFSGFGMNWSYPVKVLPPPKSAQQGARGELLKLRFLWLVGAAMYLIIGGGCANPQSPQLNRWAAMA